MLRILVIDDSPVRLGLLRQWMPDDVHAVYSTSAGRAMKLLDLDPGTVYAGIMLDHDLDQQVAVEAEHDFTGLDVARRIVLRIPPDIPVLVHSTNWSGAASMQHMLVAAGFAVTRIRFDDLTRERLLDWLEDVRAEWQYRTDE